jgi:hypothetical protein
LANSNVQHWNEGQWEVLLPNVFKILKIRVILDDRMPGGASLRASPLMVSTCMALQKYFSHPTLVIYFFATPSIKLKLGF